MKDLSGPPDATASFEAKQLRLIFGGAEGKGVLHYKGKDYPFTMTGVTVGGVGYTEVEGTAEVRFLKKIEDFPGTYNGIGAGGWIQCRCIELSEPERGRDYDQVQRQGSGTQSWRQLGNHQARQLIVGCGIFILRENAALAITLPS